MGKYLVSSNELISPKGIDLYCLASDPCRDLYPLSLRLLDPTASATHRSLY